VGCKNEGEGRTYRVSQGGVKGERVEKRGRERNDGSKDWESSVRGSYLLNKRPLL